MSGLITKMTSTTFSMRLVLEDKAAIEVTITGKGFAYDRENGSLKRGIVDSISVTDVIQNGRRYDPVEMHKLGGLNVSVDKIADLSGARFWNHVKSILDIFNELSALHDGVTRSFFSARKNVVEGTDRNDNLLGSKNDDQMFGGAGNDKLNGGAGHDRMEGGKGNDLLNGGAGNDLLIDSEGKNTLNGGAGHDTLVGGRGDDRLMGSTGRDVLYGSGGIDRLTGGKDADVFVFNTKESGRVTITDFARGDSLVNLAGGGAEESFKHFLDAASQIGKDVVYRADGLHLTLSNVKLDQITVESFADAGSVTNGMLFY